jgi:hypothetical protein
MYQIRKMSDYSKPKEKLSQKFMNSITILLYQSQLMGLVTFGRTLRPSKIRLFWNVLLFTVYAYSIGHCVYTVASFNREMIYKATDVIILVINLVYVSTAWITAITNRDLFVEFLVKVFDFDGKLQTMGIKINYQKSKKRIVLQGLIRWVVLGVLIGNLVAIALWNRAEMIVEIMAYCLLVINSAICHQSVEMIALLRARFFILNKQINQLVQHFYKKNSRNLLQAKNTKQLFALSKICALHHHLSKLVKLFNEVFGVVLLLMFGVSFTVIVITIFYLTVALQSTELVISDIVNPLLSNLTFVFDTIYVCDICYSTIEEVDQFVL